MTLDFEAQKRYRQAGQPILHELAELGIRAESVQDLWQFRLADKRAVPVLLKWLPRVDNEGVKSGLVRTLASIGPVPGIASALLNEFERAAPGNFKWSIGDAIDRVADDSVFKNLAQAAQNRADGRDREMVVVALGRMRRTPEAIDVLIKLLDDDEVAGHAITALERLAPSRAERYIEPFLSHQKPWVRRRAKRALDKIRGK